MPEKEIQELKTPLTLADVLFEPRCNNKQYVSNIVGRVYGFLCASFGNAYRMLRCTKSGRLLITSEKAFDSIGQAGEHTFFNLPNHSILGELTNRFDVRPIDDDLWFSVTYDDGEVSNFTYLYKGETASFDLPKNVYDIIASSANLAQTKVIVRLFTPTIIFEV